MHFSAAQKRPILPTNLVSWSLLLLPLVVLRDSKAAAAKVQRFPPYMTTTPLSYIGPKKVVTMKGLFATGSYSAETAVAARTVCFGFRRP